MPTQKYRNNKGNSIPGVTTVLKQWGISCGGLMWWAWNEGINGRNYHDTSQKAADAGTIAHYLIECDIKGEKADTSTYDTDLVEKAKTCYLNFLHWKDMVRFKPFATEVALVSEELQVGGTIDCIALVNSRVCIFDWKTSTGVYPDYIVQVMTYRYMWSQAHPDQKADEVYLYRMDKENAAWTLHFWQDIPEAVEAFRHLRAMYDLEKILKKRV